MKDKALALLSHLVLLLDKAVLTLTSMLSSKAGQLIPWIVIVLILVAALSALIQKCDRSPSTLMLNRDTQIVIEDVDKMPRLSLEAKANRHQADTTASLRQEKDREGPLPKTRARRGAASVRSSSELPFRWASLDSFVRSTSPAGDTLTDTISVTYDLKEDRFSLSVALQDRIEKISATVRTTEIHGPQEDKGKPWYEDVLEVVIFLVLGIGIGILAR